MLYISHTPGNKALGYSYQQETSLLLKKLFTERASISTKSLSKSFLDDIRLRTFIFYWNAWNVNLRILACRNYECNVLQTPSNHTLTSTQIVNGTFVFNLPNPVEGGLYKGKLRIPDVSQSCAGMNSTLTKEYELYVDGFKAALVVLLMAQKRQETKLQEQHSMLEEQYSNLKNLQQQLQRFHKDEGEGCARLMCLLF